MPSNISENPHKINNKYNLSITNVKGHVTPTIIEGNNNNQKNYVGEDIKINDHTFVNLDPVIKNSIKEFTDKLDNLLVEKKEIYQKNLNLIDENLRILSNEFEGVDPTKEIKNQKKKENITKNLKKLAYNLVELSPQIAKTMALMTPLSHLSQSIGEGVSFFKELIQHELSES